MTDLVTVISHWLVLSDIFHIGQIKFEIGIFCKSSNGFVVSKANFFNGGKHKFNYPDYILSIPAVNEAIAFKSQLLISKTNSELVLSSNINYNVEKYRDLTSIYIADSDEQTNCEIKPFIWERRTGDAGGF